jgi:hypothetical protein
MSMGRWLVAPIAAMAFAAQAQAAADLVTAPVLVRQNEVVSCQVVNAGTKAVDLSVELFDTVVGSIFGPGVCAGSGQNGLCIQSSVSGAAEDRWVFCRVQPGKKKAVRGAITTSGGASASAQ